MKDILNKLISLLSSKFSMRLYNDYNSNKINGDGNYVTQATRDINIFCFPPFKECLERNELSIRSEFASIIKDLQKEINDDDLKEALSKFSNLLIFQKAIMQVLTYPTDIECV